MDDATRWMAIAAGLCALLAAVAWVADYRRHRRRHLDRVGFMPWTMVFFWATTGAIVLLALAERGWLKR